MDVIIGQRRQMRDIHPETHLDFGLDQKAIYARSKWTFRSGSRTGLPGAVQSTITLNFHAQ